MTKNTISISQDEIQRAFKRLNKLSELAESPLCQLGVVTSRVGKTSSAENVGARANALRSCLLEVVERIKPDGALDYLARNWRPYLILNDQYVQSEAVSVLGDHPKVWGVKMRAN